MAETANNKLNSVRILYLLLSAEEGILQGKTSASSSAIEQPLSGALV
jgi:hypothetical protein